MNPILQDQLLPAIGKTMIHFLGSTLQWNIEDPHGILTNRDPKTYLVAFWHNRILMVPYIYSQLFPHRPAKTLISPSRDGQWINSIIEQFGFSAIRGSTSKRAIVAYRGLLYEAKKGVYDIGITPDGPRGPIYRVQQGILRLSQQTGRPILPMTYHLQSKYELHSWDRFQIPIPFSKVTLSLGAPKIISPHLTDEQLIAETDWLQNALGK